MLYSDDSAPRAPLADFAGRAVARRASVARPPAELLRPVPPAEGSALGKSANSVTPPHPPTGTGKPPDPIRRARYRLRDRLRPLAGSARVRECGRARIAPTVQVVTHAGRASLRGISTCGSVWVCPCCQATIQAERAQELGKLVRLAEERGLLVFMFSLTVRHGLGDELGGAVRGLANAWRRTTRGAPWRRFAERAAIVGTVRALEVTHGNANGWHPHLHVLVLVRPTVTNGADDVHPFELEEHGPELRELGEEVELGATPDRQLLAWLGRRWQGAVEAELGRAHRPDLVHGFHCAPAYAESYLVKLGLELASSGTKSAHGDSRTPWELAELATKGDEAAARLWRDYSEAMFRRKQLTWTRELRELFEIPEVADEVAAAREAEGPAVLVADLDRETWAAVLRRRAVLDLLEAAEAARSAELVPLVVELALRALDRPPLDCAEA